MNLPAVAARTYREFKDNGSFKKLLKYMFKKLDKITDPLKRAKYVHKKIDEEVESLFKDPVVNKLVRCEKGCSACCYSQVSVTYDEALSLVKLIEEGVQIDWTHLWVQAKAGSDMKAFLNIPYSMRACIFLDERGLCSVYEDRPSVCRTNYVVSHPDLCQMNSPSPNAVQLLNTYGADFWIYSSFVKSKENGTLPSLVKKIFDGKESSRDQLKKERKSFPTI